MQCYSTAQPKANLSFPLAQEQEQSVGVLWTCHGSNAICTSFMCIATSLRETSLFPVDGHRFHQGRIEPPKAARGHATT